MTTNRKKNTAFMVAGIIAGAATAYYLNTPKGRKMRKDIVDKTNEFKSKVVD